MSKTNGCNTPGGNPAMLENPPSSEAGFTDFGEGQSLFFCEPVASVVRSESSPLECQKSEGPDLGVGRSGLQQCVDLIQQHIEEAEVKEDIELQK